MSRRALGWMIALCGASFGAVAVLSGVQPILPVWGQYLFALALAIGTSLFAQFLKKSGQRRKDLIRIRVGRVAIIAAGLGGFAGILAYQATGEFWIWLSVDISLLVVGILVALLPQHYIFFRPARKRER